MFVNNLCTVYLTSLIISDRQTADNILNFLFISHNVKQLNIQNANYSSQKEQRYTNIKLR